MWFRPHPWSMCRLELLVRLVPLPPITYNFYLRKLRFLRKVSKSMSFKVILNSHNSLFAHIFFNSHFIRCQRLKEQCASSYGLPVNTFSAPSKSPQKSISYGFRSENQWIYSVNISRGFCGYWGFKNLENRNNRTYMFDIYFSFSFFISRSKSLSRSCISRWR